MQNSCNGIITASSVADPELFIPDPDPALNFPSSGFWLSIFRNNKKHLKFNQKDESNIYLPFSISYYSPTAQKVQNSQFYLFALTLFAGSGSATLEKNIP